MKKFIAIYHTPAAEQAKMADVTPEQYAQVMGLWGAWNEKYADNIVELGAPLMGGQSGDANGNWNGSTKEVSGYSIVQAADADAAKALFVGHPIFFGDSSSTVEIHEFVPM